MERKRNVILTERNAAATKFDGNRFLRKEKNSFWGFFFKKEDLFQEQRTERL